MLPSATARSVAPVGGRSVPDREMAARPSERRQPPGTPLLHNDLRPRDNRPRQVSLAEGCPAANAGRAAGAGYRDRRVSIWYQPPWRYRAPVDQPRSTVPCNGGTVQSSIGNNPVRPWTWFGITMNASRTTRVAWPGIAAQHECAMHPASFRPMMPCLRTKIFSRDGPRYFGIVLLPPCPGASPR